MFYHQIPAAWLEQCSLLQSIIPTIDAIT